MMADPNNTAPLKLGSHDDLPSGGGSGGSPTHTAAAASHARRRRALAAGKVAGLVALGAGIALAVALPLLLPAAQRGNSAGNNANANTLSSSTASSGTRREVFLRAEPLEWNYNPHEKGSDWDGCHGVVLEGDGLLSATGGPLGPSSTKAVWRQYEDGSFEKRVGQHAHLGVLGPTLHAEVGDALVVTVRNSLPFPVNFEAGGLELVSSSSAAGGAASANNIAAAAPAGSPPVLNPNSTATLTWRVPENAGPTGEPPAGEDDAATTAAAPTRPWYYRSTHDQVAQTQAGLYGVIAVAKRGGLDATTGLPRGVDREFVLVMQAFKEEMSPLFAADAAAAARRLLTPPAPAAGKKNSPPPRLTKADAKLLAAIDDAEAAGDDGALAEAAKAALVARGGESGAELDGGEDGLLVASTKHAINGYLYCTIPGLDMREGERVRWYLGAFGSEEALHTAHWHGEVLQGAETGRRSDQVVVQSAEAKALDMAPADNVGTWLLHCHLDDHMMHGMLALFRVGPKSEEEQQAADAEEADAAANNGRKLLLRTTPRHTNNHRRALRAGDAAPDGGVVREHFIAAETLEWDYAPFGGEMCTGQLQPFGEGASVFLSPAPDRLGRKYLKARYVAYTDDTFTKRARIGPEWEHLGLVGPVLRAEVGDLLRVTFLNRVGLPEGGGNSTTLRPTPGAKKPRVSMHPHGVLYDKASEGALYEDGTNGADRKDDAVPPGGRVTYEWRVPERSGPGPGDPSSVFWIYHSHTEEATDHHAGLFGGIIVTRKGLANDDLTPKDVDREFVLGFTIINELQSFLLDSNVARAKGSALRAAARSNETELAALLEDPGFAESNLKHGINGFMYCNLPGFQMRKGLPNRVHFFALGGGSDMHTPNSAEVTAYLSGHRKQAVQLLPGSFYSTDVTPPIAGQGMLQCAVADHVGGGMSAIFEVKAEGGGTGPSAADALAAPVREYWIAAEPVDWDYTPLSSSAAGGTGNGCPASGLQPLGEDERVFTVTTEGGVGSRYRKARYVLYEDAAMKRPVRGNGYSVGGDAGSGSGPVVPDGWTGLTGPLLSAEEGDKIVVNFLNRLPFDASIHPSGGFVPLGGAAKEANADADAAADAADGAADGAAPSTGARRLLITAGEAAAEAAVASATSSLQSDMGVKPGQRRRFEWLVPQGSGPGPGDGPAVAYSYSSAASPIAHANAGLVGPVLIYSKGSMPRAQQDDPSDSSAPVGSAERPLVLPLYLAVMNEMGSPFFDDNVLRAEKSAGVKIDREALTFPESNLMHQANGFLYCNQPGLLTLPVGTHVRWIVFGFGSETDMHSPVFSGQKVTSPLASGGTYTVGLMPASTAVIDMEATSPGSWEAYCAVTDHYFAGMRVRMQVV